jgi:hypothetical protein
VIDTGKRFEIIKVGERVFRIGSLTSIDRFFIDKIIEILDLGFKFIPCFNYSHDIIFKDLLFNVDKEILSFNKQVFLKRVNEEKMNFSNDFSSLSNSDIDTDHDPLETFFNSQKTKNHFGENIYISKESLWFEIEIFKELSKIELHNSKNLTNLQLHFLKKFLNEKPFKIVELDKNVGAGIISNTLYKELCYELLEDNSTYQELFENPIDSSIIEINNILNQQLRNKNISKKLHSKLRIISDLKLGSFRILPKVHKEKFGVRPIINYRNHITSVICCLIDFLLKPFVLKSESYIKDSQDLILKLKDAVIPRGASVLTGDFESLYSNIELNICLDSITDFMRDKISSTHLNIIAFRSLLFIVLSYNIFTFDNRFFKQIKGIAMGSRCGPSIANVFVYNYEKKWLVIHRPIAYYRFIDDLLLILIMDNEVIESLKNAFGSLVLKTKVDKNVQFLDLDISVNEFTNRLNFKLFFKPTNTFCYLYIDSNHPSYIFKNIAKSLLIRIRRICTNLTDFVYFSSVLIRNLTNRGYDKTLLDKIFTMVMNLDRERLLQYKNKQKSIDFTKTYVFKNIFDKNAEDMKYAVKTAFNNLKTFDKKFENSSIFIIQKMRNNLSSLLIHGLRPQKNDLCSYKKCGNRDCKTCKYSLPNNSLHITNTFNLTSFSDSSCNSKNLIYIIYCSFCDSFYIGQTKELKSRIYNHLFKIKRWKLFDPNNTCVSDHFNLRFHNFENHFRFFVVVSDLKDLNDMLSYESFFINLMIRLIPRHKVINDYIPSLSYRCRTYQT